MALFLVIELSKLLRVILHYIFAPKSSVKLHGIDASNGTAFVCLRLR